MHSFERNASKEEKQPGDNKCSWETRISRVPTKKQARNLFIIARKYLRFSVGYACWLTQISGKKNKSVYDLLQVDIQTTTPLIFKQQQHCKHSPHMSPLPYPQASK